MASDPSPEIPRVFYAMTMDDVQKTSHTYCHMPSLNPLKVRTISVTCPSTDQSFYYIVIYNESGLQRNLRSLFLKMRPLFGLKTLANKHPETGRNIQEEQRSHWHPLKSPKTCKET